MRIDSEIVKKYLNCSTVSLVSKEKVVLEYLSVFKTDNQQFRHQLICAALQAKITAIDITAALAKDANSWSHKDFAIDAIQQADAVLKELEVKQ